MVPKAEPGASSDPGTQPAPGANGDPGADPSADPGAKVIYLTFDDGPSGYTQAILDLLARYNAKATFFVLGRQAAGHLPLLQEIYAAGHGIGNHTYDHPYLTALSKARFDSEVLSTEKVLGEYDHGCLRPPYGAQSAAVRANAAALGYTIVMWTVDPRDWARPGAAAIANRVLSRARPNSIVLFHDGGGDRTQTVAALETILKSLSAQGYTFAALCRAGAPAGHAQPAASPDAAAAAQPASAQPASAQPASAQQADYNGLAGITPGSVVKGVVTVRGVADHADFRKWQLDLLLDGANETFLALGETPVAPVGDLLAWDTTQYPNGKHVLRLRVVYGAMNYDEYFLPVEIEN